jgi:mRNA-degrading endonuclease RelE of RelBE toxin-antitoxin system
LTHYAAPSFWKRYEALPEAVRELADKQFQLLKSNPRHPSLHFKGVGRFHSVRVGAHYRALAVDVEDGVLWFWIGTHAEYDRIVG